MSTVNHNAFYAFDWSSGKSAENCTFLNRRARFSTIILRILAKDNSSSTFVLQSGVFVVRRRVSYLLKYIQKHNNCNLGTCSKDRRKTRVDK